MTRAVAHDFTLGGVSFQARASRALWCPAERLLCVSDMHLGKTGRILRHGGTHLPPYEVQDTLQRLHDEIDLLKPATVICLGDSFDDDQAACDIDEGTRLWLTRLAAGRTWVWITGNHDPAPIGVPGALRETVTVAGIMYRHIATSAGLGLAEVSGHYHPKARLAARGAAFTRPAFLIDRSRVVMPAFGTYTGGLRAGSRELRELMADGAVAVLTGDRTIAVPYAACT